MLVLALRLVHAAGVCLSSVTDEEKYFQETGVRQLKADEIQHASQHREFGLL